MFAQAIETWYVQLVWNYSRGVFVRPTAAVSFASAYGLIEISRAEHDMLMERQYYWLLMRWSEHVWYRYLDRFLGRSQPRPDHICSSPYVCVVYLPDNILVRWYYIYFWSEYDRLGAVVTRTNPRTNTRTHTHTMMWFYFCLSTLSHEQTAGVKICDICGSHSHLICDIETWNMVERIVWVIGNTVESLFRM